MMTVMMMMMTGQQTSDAAFFFAKVLFPLPVTPHGQEASQARSLQLLFTADDRAERPVASAADDDASVGPITEGAKPVARAAGPIAEGAKRRMSQSSLSACLHRRRSWRASSCG